MTRVEIRPATAADIEAYYGQKADRTVRAHVAVVEGELAGIGGVTVEQGRMMAFCDIREGAQVGKLTVWRTAKAIMEKLATGGPLAARPDPTKPNAPRFLQRLGFRYISTTPDGDDIYLWSKRDDRH